MNPLRFLFAVHCHQPIGNFPSVIEKAFNDCYEPFLRTIERHPTFKFTLHYSGPLWEYMECHRKTCLSLVKELVGRGQAELLGGGFYEPILCLIPEEDKIGQIRLMNRYLEENFGRKPRGLWLTERVWEPSLPKPLSKAGVEYTLLDEEHFRYAGTKNLHAFYITEDEGFPLRVFPIDKKLRYLIPFRPLEEIEAYFDEIRKVEGMAVLGDDGEKFGLWPGTKKWVYEEGWLENFLRFLEEKDVRTMTFSEALDVIPPEGRIYLPPASYEEMMEWVLEPEDLRIFRDLKEGAAESTRRFLRGGFFRDFFLKYPESHHLHKRMLLVSKNAAQARDEAATRDLYKAQGNDPYWHGVFGGLYLPHLREAAFHHLLEAEKRLPMESGWRPEDYDRDGRSEMLFTGETFGLIIKPSFGGAVVEIDYRPLSRNITDVLSRRPESYHRLAEKGKADGRSIHDRPKKLPPGAEEILNYDWHPRYSCLDHFLHPATRFEDFHRLNYGEQGDFVNQAFVFSIAGNSLLLEREGGVWVEGERHPVTVCKKITPTSGMILFEYEIKSATDREIQFFFASEWNFYMTPGEFLISGNEAEILGGRLSFEAPGADKLWHFPLQTLSQSEAGYDIIHQGYCLVPIRRCRLFGKERLHFRVVLAEKNAQ